MTKDNTIYWILGIIALVAILYLKPDVGTQAIIGDPSLSYSYDFDIDAPYQQSMRWGSDIFSISPTAFDGDLCRMNDNHNAPNPNPKCWTATVDFQGEDFNFYYGETKAINDFFTATFKTTADIGNPNDEHPTYYLRQGINMFTFDMYNKDFLEAKILPQDTLLLLNENTKLKVEVRNDLANNLKGGFSITTTHYLKNQVPVITQKEVTFHKGIEEYGIDIDSSKLGRMTIEIRPYVEIMGIRFYDDRTNELTFNFVPFIDEGAFDVDCTDSPCGTGFNCNSINYEGEEYNICIKGVKGELSDFNEWALGNVDMRLIIVLFTVFAFLVYIFNKRGR